MHRLARIAQVAMDVLDDDDGRLDDDPEADGAQRDQVRRGLRVDHPGERAEQRERNVHGGHQRGPHVAEENPKHEADQQHPEHQVLEDGVGGQLGEVAAVAIRLQRHARGEQVVLADHLHPLVHALERGERVAAVAHQHDAFDDVRVEILTDDAEARRVGVGDVGHVVHADRHALWRCDHHLVDVAQRGEESDATHVVALRAQLQALPAHVLICVRDRLRQLRERQVVAAQLVGIDLDVQLARQAAERGDVDDARHLLELPLKDEVLRRLQIGERLAGPFERVAIDLADCVPGRELRL